MLLKSVRSPECFACYRCVQGCPAPGALNMSVAGRWRLPAALFAGLLLLLFVGVSVYGRSVDRWQGSLSVEALRSLPPP
jgi:hypothetical protein